MIRFGQGSGAYEEIEAQDVFRRPWQSFPSQDLLYLNLGSLLRRWVRADFERLEF
jgi:hypothetical protein